MILRCKEAVRLIASEDGREGGALQRFGLFVHLMVCDKCRRYKSQIDQIGQEVRRLWHARKDDEAIARLRNRILGDGP